MIFFSFNFRETMLRKKIMVVWEWKIFENKK